MTFQSNLGARLDAVVDKALAESRIVGGVVLVARDGVLVYRRAAGFADREEGRAMREGEVFRLASVTKPFVAATAMRLVEQGAIALDDPATRFLPEFRPRLESGEAPPLTIHSLLTHTSGLGYSFQEGADGPYHRLGVSDGLDQPGLAIEENLRRLGAAPLNFAPGAAWRYSLAMDVLGAILLPRPPGGRCPISSETSSLSRSASMTAASPFPAACGWRRPIATARPSRCGWATATWLLSATP